MKRILILGLIVVAGTLVVCGILTAYFYFSSQTAGTGHLTHATAPPPPPPLLPPVDVDALAARMKSHQDIYQKLRDDTLAAYTKRHPGQHSYDDLARMTLKLASYLWVWDDYYGEGQHRTLINYAENLSRGECSDPIWDSLIDIEYFSDRYTNTDALARTIDHCADVLAQTEYPPEFKFAAYTTCVKIMVTAKADTSIQPPLKLEELPAITAKTVGAFQELIKQHLPGDIQFDQVKTLFGHAQADDETMKALSMGIDRAFAAEDPQNPTAQLLDGEFFVDDAWTARGDGEIDTVTPAGWQLFGERLAQANQLMTDLYAKHPENPRIANVMLTVMRGQQQPRDQMELWFQRGITVDPDNFSLYMSKCRYLLPRWYGSDQDVWNFGLECASSNNWSAKIPIMLVECVSDAAERDPHIYARPEIWTPLEKVFRAYLDHYPNSVHYRSLFAKSAVSGGHWDVAREQFKILRSNWDPDVFENTEYADMRKLTAANAK
jgi:hypothetical protein